MFRRLTNAIHRRARELATRPVRRRLGQQVRALDAAGFVLISNNCLAGQLYETGGLRKATPTAGLYFFGDSYPRFLEDLACGRTATWARIEPAQLGTHDDQGCPVLVTGKESGIAFLHYQDPSIAARKWNDRFRRMEGRKKVVIASLRDGITEPMIDRVSGHYTHLHVAGPEPAPPADEFVLDRQCLQQLSEFLGGVLASQAGASRR